MRGHRVIDLIVGLFIVIAVAVLFILAFQASSIHEGGSASRYVVRADFDDIGSLMVKAPVRIAGVKIGEVVGVQLDNATFKAHVTLAIDKTHSTIPQDSAASIMTEGLLGSKYIALSPGFSEVFLRSGSMIETTHSAIILENLIGKFLFNGG